MAYELRALMCAPDIAVHVAAQLHTSTCQLTGKLHLVPLSGRTDSEARQESTFGDPMFCLTSEVEAVAAHASALGAVAYVEAAFFGSAGTQAAAVWQHGAIVWGPATWEHSAGATRDVVTPDLPINIALRRLGVLACSVDDEFDTIGLGRHRSTEDWLSGGPV